MEDLSAFSAKPRLRLLLDHFSQIKDARQSWKVAYPLREVCSWSSAPRSRTAMTTTRSSIGANANLAFLRGLSEFYHGIPCVDWLRLVMNRLDPDLFRACFSSWVQPAGRTSSALWRSMARPRAAASTCFSKRSNSRRSATRTASRPCAIASRLGCPATSSRIRPSKRAGLVGPTLRQATQNATQAHLDIMKFYLHQLTRGEQRARFLHWDRLAMHRAEGAQPHQLRDCARVVAIGLHRHRLECVAHVPCLQQLESSLAHRRIEPLRQWTGTTPFRRLNRLVRGPGPLPHLVALVSGLGRRSGYWAARAA
jgi:hypothetical protein